MIDQETEDSMDELQKILVHDLAVSEMNNADVAPIDDPENAWVEGYEKGWWAAFLSAEIAWKGRVDKYNEIIKQQEQ